MKNEWILNKCTEAEENSKVWEHDMSVIFTCTYYLKLSDGAINSFQIKKKRNTRLNTASVCVCVCVFLFFFVWLKVINLD